MAFSIHIISIRRILLPWIICLFINIVAVSSDLRAQDDTLGSKTKQLLNEIRNEVDQLGNRSPNVDRAYIAAISIMNHVQRIVSPLQYSVLKTIGEDTPKTVEECLEAKAGICGNQVACFLELAKHLKLRARPVEFYLHGKTPKENTSHICAEVYYDQAWRIFDVTWGTYFQMDGKAASIDAVRESPTVARQAAVTNETDQWFLHWHRAGLDPLTYVDHKFVDILRGRNGLIRLRGNEFVYLPTHQPTFIGLNSLSSDYGPVRIELLDVQAEVSRVIIQVSGHAGTGELVIQQSGNKMAYPITGLKIGENELVLPYKVAAGVLEVKIKATNPAKIGYVVYSRIHVSR
ncbi:MAG: transglutaminase domain-containing protein [Pirellulaceae bacterium]